MLLDDTIEIEFVFENYKNETMNGMYFDAKINGDQLIADITNINRNLSKLTSDIKNSGDKIDSTFSKIGAGIAGYFSTIQLSAFMREMVNVRGEFQKFDAVLTNTLDGDKVKASGLLQGLAEFAAKTPYQLNDITENFVKLANQGIILTQQELVKLGDFAAVTGKPIGQLFEAIMDINNPERWKEFGARIQTEGEKVSITFRNQRIEFDRTIAGAKNAIAELGSMKGVSGTMEVISETLIGQISNMEDAWDQMLNNLGKANEGTFSGMISGATALINNYDEIVKILKVLVITYGTYKAAVIATVVAQKASLLASETRAFLALSQGIGKATAAQILFNNAAKANPYGLILAGITGVVTLLALFGVQTKKAEDYVESLNESIDAIGKQASVDQLISDYNELNGKTNKTEEEQAKLNKTISELATIFPGAIRGADEYGKAIDISKEKVIELNDQLRENQRLLTEKSLSEAGQKYNDLIRQRNKLLNEVNTGKTTEASPITGLSREVELTEGQLNRRREQIAELSVDIDKLGAQIGKTQQSLTSFGSVDKEKFKQQYAELFGDVSKMTKDQAEETKNSLEKIMAEELNPELVEVVKSQIDILNKQLALPTIQEQIRKTTDELKKAKSTLDAMRKPGSQSTSTQIDDQESTIKELETTLAKLTGATKKDAEKRAADEKERQEKAIEALEDFNQRKLELERQLQASMIAVMKDGSEKQKAETELEYQLRIDQIKKQQDEYLKAYNAKQGFEPGNKGYITELPAEELAKFDQLRTDAEQQKNNKIVQINKDAAEQVKAVWAEVSDAFKSDQQKEIDAVNRKYDELTEKSGAKVGSDDFARIQEARGKEILEITQKYGLLKIDFEQELELKSLEIGESKFQTEIQREKKKADILKKAAVASINELKKRNDAESKQQIEVWEKFITEVDANLGQSISKNVAENLSLAIDFADQLTDKMKDVAGLTDEQTKAIKSGLQAFQGLAKIASGDIIGGAMQMVMAAIDSFIQAPEKLSEHYKNLETQVNKVIESANIANRTLQYLGTVNPKLNLSLINSGLKQVANDAKELNKQLQGATYGPVRSGGTNVVLGNEYRKLKAEAADLAKEMELLATRLLSGDISDEQRTAIEDTLNAYNDLMGQMDNLTNQLIGTNVNDLGKSIIEAFLAGENAAEKWGEKVSEVIKKIVVDQLAAKYLMKPIGDSVDTLIKDMEDGLTPEEAKKFKDTVQTAITATKPAVDAISKAFEELGFNFKKTETQQGLTGGIKNLTEETGGLIAGQFSAMRELNQKQYTTGLEQLDGINQSVVHLAEIAANTRHNVRLNDIAEQTAETNKILKERL